MLLKRDKKGNNDKVKNINMPKFGFSVNRSNFTSESESFYTAKYLATRMQTPGESQAWIRSPWMKGGDPLSSNLIKGASEGSC